MPSGRPSRTRGTVWLLREQLTRAGAIDKLVARFDAVLREQGRLARVVRPTRKVHTGLRIDEDVLAWCKAQGRDHQTQMNAVLRAYVEAQRRSEERGRA
jgi:uncharacterized protein (DUF4415 family)